MKRNYTTEKKLETLENAIQLIEMATGVLKRTQDEALFAEIASLIAKNITKNLSTMDAPVFGEHYKAVIY